MIAEKVYGIVGGLGAEASSKLYLDIVKETMKIIGLSLSTTLKKQITTWVQITNSEKEWGLFQMNHQNISLQLLA